MLDFRRFFAITLVLSASCAPVVFAQASATNDRPHRTESKSPLHRKTSKDDCIPHLKMLGTVADMLCFPVGDLIAEVNGRSQWQVRFTRELTPDDPTVGGQVDTGDVKEMAGTLAALGVVKVVSVDEEHHVIVLEPIPERL